MSLFAGGNQHYYGPWWMFAALFFGPPLIIWLFEYNGLDSVKRWLGIA